MDLQDIRQVVFGFIQCGSVYKAWYVDLIVMWPNADIHFANHLLTLITLLPHER